MLDEFKLQKLDPLVVSERLHLQLTAQINLEEDNRQLSELKIGWELVPFL